MNGPNEIFEKGGWKPSTVSASSWEMGARLPEPSVEKRKFQHETSEEIPHDLEYCGRCRQNHRRTSRHRFRRICS